MSSENWRTRFGSMRVAVIGDLMLDVYLWGKVSRISPEAPVPVVNVRKREARLGGAANVIRNLSTLGAGKIFAFGVIGSDPSGRELNGELEKINCRSFVLTDPARPTTEKKRVIAGAQQLLREDFEDTSALNDALRSRMVEELTALVRDHEVDAVIFEDYAKGVLASPMLEAVLAETHRCGIPAVLDPKPGNLAPVKGLTAIKPNRSEAFAMANMSDPGLDCPPEKDAALLRAAEILEAEWAPENLLVSLASQGMGIFRNHRWATMIPTRAREVFDVSGAGDTVTATFVLALASGSEPAEAAELANCAAGVVVGKIGTAPIEIAELENSWKELKK